ncbi:hypothetical protein D3C87_1457290 [compost metagenome]
MLAREPQDLGLAAQGGQPVRVAARPPARVGPQRGAHQQRGRLFALQLRGGRCGGPLRGVGAEGFVVERRVRAGHDVQQVEPGAVQDDAGPPRLRADALAHAFVRGQQRQQVAPRRMAHDDEAVRVGMPAGGLPADPGQGAAQVFRLRFGARLRHQPGVDRDDGKPLGQPVGDFVVHHLRRGLVAVLP